MKSFSRPPSYRWLLLGVVAAIMLAPLTGVAAGAPNPPASSTAIPLPDGANVVVQPQARHDKGPFSGLDSTLSQLAAAYQAGDQAALAAFGDPNIDLASGAARVILQMAVDPQAHPAGEPVYEQVALPGGRRATIEHAPPMAIRPDLAAAIAATGATYETAYDTTVQVLAPFASLPALGKLDGIEVVRLPFPSQPDRLPPRQALAGLGPLVGAQTTQGVNLTGVNIWHSSGYDGAGVNLAIYDFGFTGWNTLQASGDLPSGVNLVLHDFSAAYDFGPPGTAGYPHGAACAEIAYDMAPGATVHLYAFGTSTELGNAVTDYIGVSGKKVATMSVGYVNAGPYDGTGSINTMIDNAQTAGIYWANSAGNYQKQHWSGTATQYSGGDGVAFGGGNIQGIGSTSGSLWNIASGTNLRIFLAWNDWNAARTGNQNHIDYDVELYRRDGTAWVLVGGAYNNQCTGTIAPVESFSYTVPSGGPYNYAIAIWRYQGGGACPNNFGHWLSLYTFNGFFQTGAGSVNSFWYVNQCNSVIIPADGNSAVATGATFWGEDGTSPLYGLETFSSLGPRNAAGGGNPGVTVNKPDVVAPDGVNVATAAYGVNGNVNFANGGGGFWGTSAASPHVAGLAASIWEGRPAYTLAQVRTLIQQQAVYKADGGVCGGSRAPQSATQNNRYGWGRINVLHPLAVTLASFTAQGGADRVTVAWETVSEMGNAGFNLYRSDSAAGPQTLLAYVPSQAPGSTAGFSYIWTDQADLTPGATYYYWLEDVSLGGATTLHGPVSATVQAPTAVTLGSLDASPAATGSALPWLLLTAGAGMAFGVSRLRRRA